METCLPWGNWYPYLHSFGSLMDEVKHLFIPLCQGHGEATGQQQWLIGLLADEEQLQLEGMWQFLHGKIIT